MNLFHPKFDFWFPLCLIIIAFITLNPVFSSTQTGLWQVGIARVDITPADTLWMAGYAARNHPAEGTSHKLWAKAIAVQDSSGYTGLLITTDLLGFPKNLSDSIRDRLIQKYGLSRAQVILNSSHTHSGPVLRQGLYDIYPLTAAHIEKIENYSRQLSDKIVSLAGEAIKNKRPMRLFADNGLVRFQVNRRNNETSTLSTFSHLNGPNDYAVPVLKAVNPAGEPAAILFGYACHATTLDEYFWSGDYPGYAQLTLEQMYPGVCALFFQGCGADQNPIPRRSDNLARQYGLELAAAVDRVVRESASPPLAPELTTGYMEIDLTLATPPTLQELRDFAKQVKGYRLNWANNMIKKLQNGGTLPQSVPCPVQIWKLGDQVIITLGGEVVVDYAIRLKEIFGQNVFVMGYSNDVMAYIPTVRILREGGYEGATAQMVYGLPSSWQADIETRIIHAVLQLADKMGIRPHEENVLEE
ncbi:neutral/alkaline non-lysosomal ceramidase N-terminal domain-containing protein [candidate division KSB1 bacterium]|nr:neutral/alkaline non-lysosomal ceramidase N-terminal domain-containing protein [candidate division KSB1 bacterium]